MNDKNVAIKLKFELVLNNQMELIFEFIGAYFRFLYGTSIRKLGISKSPYYSFFEYLNGSKKKEDDHWDKNQGIISSINMVVGIIILLIVLLCISYIAYYL